MKREEGLELVYLIWIVMNFDDRISWCDHWKFGSVSTLFMKFGKKAQKK